MDSMQNRTVFIGGAPRIGKTMLAHELARRLEGHMTSTDWIKNAVKKSHPEREGGLFVFDKLNRVDSSQFVEQYTNGRDGLIHDFETLAQALWLSIESFCNGFYDDDLIHIVEGTDIQPKLVNKMTRPPEIVIFVGNTSPTYVESVLAYSNDFEADWMNTLGYTMAQKEAVAQFSVYMSTHIREQALQYGYEYVELEDFLRDKEAIVNSITSRITQ